jgi:rhomboid family GlyGly-CTERM serine protease
VNRFARFPESATWRAPWLSASLTLSAFAVDRFQWDLAMRREAVLRGELFRIVTGHLCHFNRAHLLGDALAFAFWAACAEQRGRRFLASTLLVTVLGCSLLFLAFYPEVGEYRGLSAIDCALAAQFIVNGVADRRRARDVTGAAFFASAGLLFFGKTLFEFHTGHALLAPHLGDKVALLPVSHLAGVAFGLAWLAVAEWTKGCANRDENVQTRRVIAADGSSCVPDSERGVSSGVVMLQPVRMGNSTMFPFDFRKPSKRLTIDRRIDLVALSSRRTVAHPIEHAHERGGRGPEIPLRGSSVGAVNSMSSASATQQAVDDPAIERVMKLLYAVISFEEGDEPNWKGLQEVFSKHARITRVTPEGTDHMDVSNFVAMTRNLVDVGVYTSFYEFELARNIDKFGDIAQVWSHYETRRNRNARDALGRGVNSIQLIREENAWRVLGLLWDETRASTISPSAPVKGVSNGQG